MNNNELIEELLADLCILHNDGLPNLRSDKSISYISEFFNERGMWETGQMIIENLFEDDKEFKNPDLNKVIPYTNVNGKKAEGKVGNLLRRPDHEDAYKQALASLGGKDSDRYKKAMDDLGAEGQPNRDIEGEREKGEEKSGEVGGEEPETGTALKDPAYQKQIEREKEIQDKLDADKDKTTNAGEKKDLGAEDKENKTKESNKKNREKNKRYLKNTKGVTSINNIDGIDGLNKENVLNGKETVPGSESSAVAEISVGYGMSCLSENDFDIQKADDCLKGKLSKTKLGKSFNKDSIRKGALQSANRELIKVGKIIEETELNPQTTTVGHVGGSSESLSNTVKTLRNKGVKEVNGISIDEYEKIIIEGGGGSNPTDTMVVIIDESNGKSFIYHTSNKMSSADQISNGSPYNEIKEIGNLVEGYSEEQKEKLKSAQKEARDNIQNHRQGQKEYIRNQQSKMAEHAKDPNIARKAVDRLKGVENPISTSSNTKKYWELLLKHPSVNVFAKEMRYDVNNLTPDQEVEIYQHYTDKLKDADPEKSRARGGVGEVDIQIITRLYGVFGNPKRNQEELTTGREPTDPIYDEDVLNSYYDKQTIELNTLREKMNNIKEGSGDASFSKRMIERLHLNVAEGYSPGGIPNDKFETIMGEYAFKDLKMDEDGNVYQKKGKDFFLVLSDGSLSDEPYGQPLKDLDVSVVADKDTLKKCLGLGEDDDIQTGIEIRVDEYDNRMVIIYDKFGKQVAFQSARSKSGPGGAMQDTIAYHKDFQQCLAKQTVLLGKS